MRRGVVLGLMMLGLCGVASAHRLDEYLQATMISLDKDHVQASMRMIPGVAVSAAVIASIDTNGDGVLSEAEQRAYAESLVGELTMTLDGVRLKPRVVTSMFPTVGEIREGTGEIHIELVADVQRGGPKRTLVFENHHDDGKTVFLMNCLVPVDHDLHVVGQRRNPTQSRYELDYEQAGATAASSSWNGVQALVGASSFVNLFKLGVRHIAEGTDHLLFLLALLLPAPLLARGRRWDGVKDVRASLLGILKIVTAFTIGHSLTLGLAAMGFVHVPSRPIEVLIAVSILVSAVHALRPLFPGKEAAIAAFFGLIHGLAFAATLTELGLGRWERVGGILAFNLGIEAMQLVVVLVTMPTLLLLSRVDAYRFVRVGGALFAGFAAMGWIVERMLGLDASMDAAVSLAAHYAGWVAVICLPISLACWVLRRPSAQVVSRAMS